MHIAQLILAWKAPVTIGLAILEAICLYFLFRRKYKWKEMGVSFFEHAIRTFIVKPFIPFSIAAPILYFAVKYNLGLAPASPILAFIVMFLIQDCAAYWFHRTTHRVRWLWATHAVHHTPNDLNLSTGFRTGITKQLSGWAIVALPTLLLGFPPAVVTTSLAIEFLYNYWVHNSWIPKLGWLEYVLITPSNHRVHHAANVEYLDANYGEVLIIWDRLFGTYIEEREDLPCRYGLVTPLTSNNPFYVEFHEWIALFRDLHGAKTAREWLGHIFGPPGWRPEGDHMTTEGLRRAAAQQVAQATPAE